MARLQMYLASSTGLRMLVFDTDLSAAASLITRKGNGQVVPFNELHATSSSGSVYNNLQMFNGSHLHQFELLMPSRVETRQFNGGS